MKTTICLVILLIGSSLLFALEGSAFLKPEPGFAELGALPEPMDTASLEKAALLASGLAEEALPPYQRSLGRILAELGSESGRIADPAARAEAALGFLHKNVLKAYQAEATTLDGILDSGLYNCVSSAVLYVLVLRSLGIEASGVRTSDHAFATVLIGGRSVDVETTNPYGFDPGGKKEFKDSFGSVTGFAYVAPGGYGDRKSVGARDLIGLILSNRVSNLERQRRYADAVKLGADYAALCPGPVSQDFLEDRINNLVADLESRRDFAGAEETAQAAAAALPGKARLAALVRTTSYNRAAALAQSGDWAAAFEAALRVAAAAPGDRAAAGLVANSLGGLAQDYARRGEYEAARRAVAERGSRAGAAAAAAALSLVGEFELVHAANSLPFTAAAAAADRIFSAGEVSKARYAQALASIYGNEAGRIGSGGDWLKGAAIADLGNSKAPGDGNLARLAQSLRRNFVAEAHNRFAGLYNSGDYAGARAAIVAALSVPEASFAGDPSLTRDLAAADSALRNK